MIPTNLKLPLIVLAVALVVGYFTFLHQRIDTLTAQRDLARSQVSALSAQIEDQNDAVLALEAAAAQNREVYLAGLRAAEKRAVRLTVQAEDVLNLPPPQNPDEACEYAAGVLRGVTQ